MQHLIYLRATRSLQYFIVEAFNLRSFSKVLPMMIKMYDTDLMHPIYRK